MYNDRPQYGRLNNGADSDITTLSAEAQLNSNPEPSPNGKDLAPYEDLNIATRIGKNSFFHTNITRQQAESLLVNPGDFLLRVPRRKELICLSVLDDNNSHHHLLLDSGDIAVVRHSYDNCLAFNMKNIGNQILKRPIFNTEH